MHNWVAHRVRTRVECLHKELEIDGIEDKMRNY